MPGMQEIVLSRTLRQSECHGVTVSDDARNTVVKLKAEPGKDIWLFGGASLTSSLLNMNLIDELHLSVHPLLLGKGKPLFININKRIALQLSGSKCYNTGLVQIIYRLKSKGL